MQPYQKQKKKTEILSEKLLIKKVSHQTIQQALNIIFFYIFYFISFSADVTDPQPIISNQMP